MKQVIEWKQNDLLPEVNMTLFDARGPVVLTGATVKFIMRAVGGATKINASATVVTALLGQVRYTPTGTDTDTAGNFEAEWQVTIGGKKWSFPNTGYIPVVIRDDIAD